MKMRDFDYQLPDGRIALYPPVVRGDSRLMVVERESGRLLHGQFKDLPTWLHAGDLLVVNNSRVIPARLRGRCRNMRVELLLLRRREPRVWEAIGRPMRRLHPGDRIQLAVGSAFLLSREADRIWIRLEGERSERELMVKAGEIPLPPYISRSAEPEDRQRYQTVYARHDGSVAAPTAGLHFTDQLIERFAAADIKIASVTLHVGWGTFRPVQTEDVESWQMAAEYCRVPVETVKAVRATQARGGRVIAVGTTTVRALESASGEGELTAFDADTRLFIYPGYCFRSVDAMITNFHLSRSTLLLMVAAFAGRELIQHAYQTAIRENYRFYSYGDAMLIF